MPTTATRTPRSRLESLAYGYAANARTEFADRNGRVSEGGAVHRVELGGWLDGTAAPRPACHVGVDGWEPWRVTATAAPVSCRRCLRSAAPAGAIVESAQVALF